LTAEILKSLSNVRLFLVSSTGIFLSFTNIHLNF
jgi:hypothetical protein